jgi:tetratricopeptide (TPR) repeat protein
MQGDLKSAEAAFRKVTRLAPKYAEAWVNIGITHLREGNLAAAQQALDTALKMRPNVAGVHYYLALVAKSQGEYDQALVHLKKIVAKHPRDRVARNERGHLYLLMQDYERAVLDFEKVLSIDPENPEAYYYLIKAYGVIGETEKAKQAEILYNRFKAGTPSSSVAQPAFGDGNVLRERQPLHEHLSGPLPASDEKAESMGQ